jgi:hypothetical protein
MSAGIFVNPLPRLYAFHLLQFDFPADKRYCAPATLPNVNVEAPLIEAVYGRLGTPRQEQGHPLLREVPYPEAEDPGYPNYHDQIIDIDRNARIYNTGRLSGSFVKYLAHDTYKSIVRIDAHPLTHNGDVVSIARIEATLKPAPPAANVWFWKDPKQRNELLFTARADFDPNSVGRTRLEPENVYKLIIRWEFWDTSVKPAERMPMSGFNEFISFQVSQKTQNL